MSDYAIAAVARPDTPQVRDLLELAVGVGRADRLLAAVAEYRTEDAHLVGAYDQAALIGVAGFRVHETRIVLKHLATHPASRRRRVGRSLVDWLSTRMPNASRSVAARTHPSTSIRNSGPRPSNRTTSDQTPSDRRMGRPIEHACVSHDSNIYSNHVDGNRVHGRHRLRGGSGRRAVTHGPKAWRP